MAVKNNKDSLAGTKIQAVSKEGEKPEIGIKTDSTFLDNIIDAGVAQALDLSVLQGFSTVAQTREKIYQLIDTMSQDSTLAAVLETYSEDVCEPNDQGKVVWCESSDADVAKNVNFLLDCLNVDKHSYSWVHSLIKYGDVYLRLYRQSDYEADEKKLFGEGNSQGVKNLNEEILDDSYNKFIDKDKKDAGKTNLKEDVNLQIHAKEDHYVHYAEMVSNPGEIFELTKFGKSVGYVQAPLRVQTNFSSEDATLSASFTKYKVRKSDVNIYPATEFVHGYMEDNSSRTPEEVNIYFDGDLSDLDSTSKIPPLSYKVRRGQSLLYNQFKNWRELSLLENSVLLNRITKSSIIRTVLVEVGDMPKEKVGPYLAKIKSLIEQKSAINTGSSMQEYTNPGPVENNVYLPVHNGQGSITTTQIGGDVDPKKLTDIEHFQDKLFGGLRVPKQFFGITDDSTGFNGGTSLTILSSSYGKAIKRIQNTYCQMLTDVVNLMLLDAGYDSYINKFTLRMQTPVTQEEVDKRTNSDNRIRYVSDVMSQLSDIQDVPSRLKILKSLLSSVVNDPEVIDIIQRQITKLENEAKAAAAKNPVEGEEAGAPDKEEMPEPLPSFGGLAEEGPAPVGEEEIPPAEGSEEITAGAEAAPEEEAAGEESYMPSPAELGVNLVNNK